jgi:hypothetical protein
VPLVGDLKSVARVGRAPINGGASHVYCPHDSFASTAWQLIVEPKDGTGHFPPMEVP